MGRDRKSKYKLSRRERKDLFGTDGESLQRRLDQPPGMHGRKPTRKESVYAEQLREKQRVKRMYGIRGDQFRHFLETALQTRKQTGLALLKMLERRLDNVVYRLGLVRTRPQARQFVTHGLVRVNGRRLNIPSYLVKPGEEIEMKQSALEIPDVQEMAEAATPVPGWLEKRDGSGVVLREPNREEIDPDIRERRIVEFYSRGSGCELLYRISQRDESPGNL
jgi:small subunit ribosomal protein S4